MHIVVTNDDGVRAPGLLALVEAMQSLGSVTVVAPDRNWSASGHVKTMSRPLRVHRVKLANGVDAFASDGAPSDCVCLALLGIAQGKVDLVVSGINPHANLGHDVTYSGTVTAAMEAVISGVPGVAFSLDTHEDDDSRIDYTTASQVARQFVEKLLKQPLQPQTLLSVNIPYLPMEQIKGWMATRQGLRIYRDRLDTRKDPRGREYYWIGGDAPTGVPENGTDVGALAQGFVSVTPLMLDLTHYPALNALDGLLQG